MHRTRSRGLRIPNQMATPWGEEPYAAYYQRIVTYMVLTVREVRGVRWL